MRRRSGLWSLLALFVIAGLIAAACTGAPGTTTASPAGDAGEARRRRLRGGSPARPRAEHGEGSERSRRLPNATRPGPPRAWECRAARWKRRGQPVTGTRGVRGLSTHPLEGQKHAITLPCEVANGVSGFLRRQPVSAVSRFYGRTEYRRGLRRLSTNGRPGNGSRLVKGKPRAAGLLRLRATGTSPPAPALPDPGGLDRRPARRDQPAAGPSSASISR